MALPATTSRRPPLALFVGCAAALVVLAAVLYLSLPAPKPPENQSATEEAKAYVRNLRLSDVTMQATENFMKQQVIEVQGKISNDGPRPINAVDVYCLFYGVDGREIHRERLPIVRAKAGGLKPGQAQPFRLPFDSLPDGWNQAMPHLVIAQIAFEGAS
jgi:hypothetical protein